jgi:hypothetical protein
VHIKAVSPLQLSLRYEITTFTAKILQCCGPRWPCLDCPQKVSSEQPFPGGGRFWQARFPVSEKFPAPGGGGAPRGFEGSLHACSDLYCPGRGLSPNGDRYIHIGSLSQRAALRLNCAYICDEKFLSTGRLFFSSFSFLLVAFACGERRLQACCINTPNQPMSNLNLRAVPRPPKT